VGDPAGSDPASGRHLADVNPERSGCLVWSLVVMIVGAVALVAWVGLLIWWGR
jgi:hypothetical protein